MPLNLFSDDILPHFLGKVILDGPGFYLRGLSDKEMDGGRDVRQRRKE
jgi:hypothetical protein